MLKMIDFCMDYIRTSLGGFFNHSTTPNCEAIYENDFIKIRTLSIVNSGDEITVDYATYINGSNKNK